MLDTVQHRLYKETVLWDCQKKTLLVYYIFKELSKRMVQQSVWVVLLFNGKVREVNIYSVILVTNSYDESWDSSCEKQ